MFSTCPLVYLHAMHDMYTHVMHDIHQGTCSQNIGKPFDIALDVAHLYVFLLYCSLFVFVIRASLSTRLVGLVLPFIEPIPLFYTILLGDRLIFFEGSS